MFKKILEAIKEVKSDMGVYYHEISKDFIGAQIERKTVEELSETLRYYANLYNQIISEKYENDNNAFEAVVFVPYRGEPLVFKDGKKVSTDTMSGFDVDWSWDRKTEVTIRND